MFNLRGRGRVVAAAVAAKGLTSLAADVAAPPTDPLAAPRQRRGLQFRSCCEVGGMMAGGVVCALASFKCGLP